MDEIKVAVDGLRMNCVVFLLLTSLANDLDGLDAVVLFVPPVDDPHLVQMLHIVHIDRVSIGHNHLSDTAAFAAEQSKSVNFQHGSLLRFRPPSMNDPKRHI